MVLSPSVINLGFIESAHLSFYHILILLLLVKKKYYYYIVIVFKFNSNKYLLL